MRECLDDRSTASPRVLDFLVEAKIARVALVLILGAMGSLPLVFLIPPFQAPDEVQHFYRAYQLSQFEIKAEVRDGEAGGTLPVSLPKLVKASVYTPDGILYPARPAPLAKTLRLASIPLEPSAREFVEFPGSAFYSPLAYVPQALGIAVGRAMGLGPLGLLYAGRLVNCLAALGLLGLAVFVMPFAEELVALVGLLPMALYLYATVSSDAAVIGCALLFTALSFAASARGEWKAWELCAAAAAAAVFCSVKPVYAPLLLAGLFPGLLRRGQRGSVMRAHAILVAAAVGVTAAWMLFAKSAMTTPLSGAHPSAQIHLVLHDPMDLMRALGASLGIHAIKTRYVETVGVFGWLTVPMRPRVVYVLPLAGFAMIWMFGRRAAAQRSTWVGVWHLALALASALLVMVAMYLMWAHVGQASIIGVQGRYFVPVLALAGVGLMEMGPRSRSAARKWVSLASVAAVVVVEVVAMDTAIIRGFHLS